MLNKRIIAVIFIFLLFCSLIATQAEAIKGFGSFTIEKGPNGELIVRVNDGTTMKDDQDFWRYSIDIIMIKYGKTLAALSGILTITLVIVFVVLCVKCSFLASEHWILKRQAMMALLWVGIGAALMGSSTLFFVLFQNILK